MAGCCDPSGYRKVFNSREAEKAVRRFRRKGLDPTAEQMVVALKERDIVGSSLLEVGAGAGAAQVVLLQSGVERSVAYDISPGYEKVSAALFAEYGLSDRVEWHTGDFLAADTSGQDVVFLNRVVCCYPRVEPLVDSVTEHAGRLLALSYPRDRWFVRIGSRVINRFLRWRNVGFQVYIHDPESIETRVAAKGLTRVASGRTAIWTWNVWERATA